MQPTIAVDLAKNVFEIAVSRHPGEVAERHRVSRARLLRFFAQGQPAAVLLEACSSAHFWARELQKLGHQVVLLPPHLVRPYRRRHHKTDRADAKALLEACRNEEIRPVPDATSPPTSGSRHESTPAATPEDSAGSASGETPT